MTNERPAPLRPAEDNLWYVLATIHGKVKSEKLWAELEEYDRNTILRNQNTWNKLMYQKLTEKDRKKIVETGFLHKELGAITPEEERKIMKKLQFRFEENGFQEDGYNLLKRIINAKLIDMGGLQIKKPIYMAGFIFSDVVFYYSEFHEIADFEGAYFGEGKFDRATFKSDVNFKETIFNGNCSFPKTIFELSSSFEKVKFYGGFGFQGAKFNTKGISLNRIGMHGANFKESVFFIYSNFSEAEFYSRVDFSEAEFYGSSYFHNVKFEDKTDFIDADFKIFPPEFYGAELHKNTIFTKNDKKWPVVANNPETKNAYDHLRHLMHNQLKPDEEHFFYRREMAWKAHHEGWFNWLVTGPYGWFSGYGYSFLRPLAWFALVLLLPAFLVGLAIPFDNGWLEKLWVLPEGKSGWRVLGVSTANMFPFLGFERQYVFGDLEKEPWGWLLVGGAQSLLALMFLFLFGLALRNRFRLR